MNMFLVSIIALALMIPSQAQDKAEIDAVLGLLDNLRQGTQKEVEALDSAWNERKTRKQSILESLSLSAQEQRSECSNRESDVAAKQKDINITNDYISWLLSRQLANNNRISILEANRCLANDNFVNDIKNYKVALSLVRFLKKELQRAQKVVEWGNIYFIQQQDDLSLLEQHSLSSRVENFLQLYKTGRLLKMVQVHQEDQTVDQEDEDTLLILEGDVVVVVEDESAALEEHINGLNSDQDHPQDPFSTPTDTRPDLSSIVIEGNKSELEKILDDLDKDIQSDLNNGQDNSVRAAMGYIDFKIHIEKENRLFDNHLLDEADNLVRLNNQLTTRVQASNLCKSRLNQINTALAVSQEDFNASQSNYQESVNSKQEEVTVFEEVYRIYLNQVAKA